MSDSMTKDAADERQHLEPVAFDAAHIANMAQEGFPDESRGRVTWKTLFSSEKTSTNELTAGIATCPPNGGNLTLHRHDQAEIYHVTEGEGSVEISGKIYPIKQGSVVYIPGDVEHDVRNTGTNTNLVWLYCFAADSFGDVHYRFS